MPSDTPYNPPMVVNDSHLASALAAHLCLDNISFQLRSIGSFEFSVHARDYPQLHLALGKAKTSIQTAKALLHQETVA